MWTWVWGVMALYFLIAAYGGGGAMAGYMAGYASCCFVECIRMRMAKFK